MTNERVLELLQNTPVKWKVTANVKSDIANKEIDRYDTAFLKFSFHRLRLKKAEIFFETLTCLHQKAVWHDEAMESVTGILNDNRGWVNPFSFKMIEERWLRFLSQAPLQSPNLQWLSQKE